MAMPLSRSVPAASGYVVTEQGKLDLLTLETCQCNPRLAGLLVVCECCGTVYGSVKDSMDWGRGLGRKRD